MNSNTKERAIHFWESKLFDFNFILDYFQRQIAINTQRGIWSKLMLPAWLYGTLWKSPLMNSKGALYESKKEGKDQESIQSSTTPDTGYQESHIMIF